MLYDIQSKHLENKSLWLLQKLVTLLNLVYLVPIHVLRKINFFKKIVNVGHLLQLCYPVNLWKQYATMKIFQDMFRLFSGSWLVREIIIVLIGLRESNWISNFVENACKMPWIP